MTISPPEIPIIYQDEFLVVVHKPAGMLVHRGMGAQVGEHFLMQVVRDQINTFIYPVHRLDRATSGLVVFALTSEVARELQNSWQTGLIKKSYQAIVRGWIPESEGLRDEALDDPDNGKQYEAQTRWKVLETCTVPFPIGAFSEARYSLMELEPLTGRWHQLRRHFSRMKHPIIGDTTHGDRHHNHMLRDRLGWWRLLLAANSLEFPHPATGMQIMLKDLPARGLAPYWDVLLGIGD
jgi:tRNA pseudouridine65 synthase